MSEKPEKIIDIRYGWHESRNTVRAASQGLKRDIAGPFKGTQTAALSALLEVLEQHHPGWAFDPYEGRYQVRVYQPDQLAMEV